MKHFRTICFLMSCFKTALKYHAKIPAKYCRMISAVMSNNYLGNDE